MCISLPRFLLLITVVGPAASSKTWIRRQQHRDHMAVISASSSITFAHEEHAEHVERSVSPETNFEVDVVYTALLREPSASEYVEINRTCGLHGRHSGNKIQRYRDLGTLKYSIYSVLLYLPWVRKIFIVTSDGRLPDWVETLEPERKLKFVAVSHKQIWPEDKQTSELPTHNSNAIEVHVHRCPGLSERFLYFNDDFFIGRALSRQYFFNDDGSAVYWDMKSLDVESLDMKEMMGMGGSVIEGDRASLHQAQPYRKSVMYELQKAYPQEFARASSERCRPEADPTRFMPLRFLSFFQVKSGNAKVKPVVGNIEEDATWLVGMMEAVGDPTVISHWYRHTLKLRPKRFCIEDDFPENSSDFARDTAAMHDFFVHYFGADIARAGLPP